MTNYQYVPCKTCRGGKFMMKLGGIYGECNTCGGTGEVKVIKEEKPITEVSAYTLTLDEEQNFKEKINHENIKQQANNLKIKKLKIEKNK